MLLLTRKHGQVIRIGDDITIKVVGRDTKIAIDAPREVRVVREELLETVEEKSNVATNNT